MVYRPSWKLKKLLRALIATVDWPYDTVLIFIELIAQSADRDAII